MKQGAAAGAALRFLQAGAAPHRKNRLSARGFTWYHGRPKLHKAPPAVKSCALSQAPGLRPCESKVLPIPAPIIRGGDFLFFRIVLGSEPLSRGAAAGRGLPLWAGGWVQMFPQAERQSFWQAIRRAALREKEQSVVQSPPTGGRRRSRGGTSAGGRAGLDKK